MPILKQSEEEYKCPKCKDTGFYSYYEGIYEMNKECECGIRQKRIIESQLLFSNIPEKYKECNFENFDLGLYEGINRNIVEKTYKAVRWYFDNFDECRKNGKGLFIYSECKGSGKTRLVLSLANELINKKLINVKFATSLVILSEIKNSWNKESYYTESKLLDNLISTPVLIIDDFGTEKTKDWITEKFYSIVNGRYNDKKITIFTSNYNLANIDYDSRITDRIDENCYKIPFPNVSIRKIEAKKNDDFMKQFL